MALFFVEFEKRIEVTVEAESEEEAREAAEAEDLNDWDAEWEIGVAPVSKQWKNVKYDFGVIDGEFVEPDEYRRAKADLEAAKAATDATAPHICDPNQMSLPLPEMPT